MNPIPVRCPSRSRLPKARACDRARFPARRAAEASAPLASFDRASRKGWSWPAACGQSPRRRSAQAAVIVAKIVPPGEVAQDLERRGSQNVHTPRWQAFAADASTWVRSRFCRLSTSASAVLQLRAGPERLEAVLFRRLGHLFELLDPPIVGLVAQRLQGIGKPIDEGLRQLRRELPFPLRDVAGANVPAIQIACCAEQAVIPEPILAGILLGLVEAEKRQDLRPQHHRAVQPQVLVANLQPLRPIVSPPQHLSHGAAGRPLT